MAFEQKEYVVVVGLGQTGKSCVRFLLNKGKNVVAVDTRDNPPNLREIQTEFPQLKIVCGSLDESLLKGASEIVVSPGVSLREPAIKAALDAGISVIGDIALFRRYVKKPIVAITGSNAKSTVTTLVGKLLQDSGMNAVVAGNIGIPVMELLNQDIDADTYVLELSSFQLETTHNLGARVATILNVSEDHMDRYQTIDEYVAAKQKIFEGCEIAIVNKDDQYSIPANQVANILYFHEREPVTNEFGLVRRGEDVWLAMDQSPIIKASDLKIKGTHNQLNALAGVAIGKAMGVPMESMICTLNEFTGLNHRCQWVSNIRGVDWFNDSKGTNVGATEAAINGIGSELKGKIILIAGGEGKGADFTILQGPVRKYVKKVFLIGRDANLIESALDNIVSLEKVDALDVAVSSASQEAQKGDAILLSPACASFDMFKGFEDRGNQFLKLVNALEARP